MITPKITVVCGFGRCGTSLAMQMLDAGGMPAHGSWPAYEDTEAHGGNRALMATLPGKAVKMLDHQLRSLTGEHAYDFVWLDRNHIEQAKSALKLMQALGFAVDTGARSVKIMARSYPGDRSRLLVRLRSLPDSRVLRLRFEDLINRPLETAEELTAWLGRPLDVTTMAVQVRPRSVACLPGMLELEQIAQLKGRAA